MIAQINAVYDRCLDHLKSTVSYCFANKKANPANVWTIATWSVRVARSSIEKKGTAGDKAKLPPSTNRNKARTKGLQRKRKESANPLYLRRQQQRQQRRRQEDNSNKNDNSDTSNHQQLAAPQVQATPTNNTVTFENAFPMPELNERMQRRDREIANLVAEEAKQDAIEQRNERAVGGDAIAADGSLLFVARQAGIQAPNVGDNSRVSRSAYTNSLAGQLNRNQTPCPIPGCQWSHQIPPHWCHNSSRCSRKVHNMCAQANGLCSNENEIHMYCSQRCKQQKEG